VRVIDVVLWQRRGVPGLRDPSFFIFLDSICLDPAILLFIFMQENLHQVLAAMAMEEAEF
jgi:hypothetical protein